MILEQVEIFEFKSIKHIKLPINDIMCLVGKNESGKTNIIEAISFLNIFEKKFNMKQTLKTSKRYRNGYPMVSGLFSLKKSEIDYLTDYSYSSVLLEIAKENNSVTFEGIEYLELKRWGNSLNDIELKILNAEKTIIFSPIEVLDDSKQKNEFLEKFFFEFFPSIDFFSDEEFVIEPASSDELLGKDRKFKSFRRLLKVGGINDLSLLNSDIGEVTEITTDAETVLTSIFNKFYLQDNSIKILLRQASGKWNVLIQDSTKKTYALTERSPGFQYFFAFIFNKHFLNGNSNKNSIYLLDEPGKSLHPRGSKDLLRAFKEVSDKSQIVYTTHNAFLAIRDNLDSLLLVTKNNKDGTCINMKPYRNKYEVLRKELGILLNDSFILSDINLLVEGPTEKFALHHYFNESNHNDLEWLNIINCESVNEIKPTIKYLNNLNLKGIVLVDSDKAGKRLIDNAKFKELTKNKKQWQVMQLNDIFTSKAVERTFEDLFSTRFYVKAYNKFYNSNNDVFDFKESFEPLDETLKFDSPIVNAVQVHLKEFCDSSLNKVAVVRNYFE